MRAYLVRRLLYAGIAVVGAVIVVFIVIRMIGDPAAMTLGVDASPAELAEFRQHYGLDRPIHEQFLAFVVGILTLNWGESLHHREPVLKLLLDHLPATLQLALLAELWAIVWGIPLGVIAALHRNRFIDRATVVAATWGQSMPHFWLGLMGILVFSVQLGWLPPSGKGSLANLLMPALALSTSSLARVTRLQRSSLLEVLQKEYVTTARAKGLAERVVIYAHAVRNALIPVVTMIGLDLAAVVGGAVIVETVFAWPGVGRLIVQALVNLDYPLVQGGILLIAGAYVLMSLLVDLSYAVLDPRIRYE